MAEKAAVKSKKTVVCALCDKAITDGKPVIIDEDPYHTDCAKAMSQSSDEAEDEDADESDEDEEDEQEEEVAPAPAKKGKAVAKKAPVVVEEDDDDDDDEDEDEEEEEEAPAPKKAVAKTPAKAPAKKAPVVEDDDDEDEDEEDEDEEEEEEAPAPKKKAVAAVPAKKAKRAAADYDEEEEPVAPAKKAKTAAAPKAKVAAVDNSGWGNPAREGSKRYFVFQAMHDVTKADLREADGPGKPENIIAAAKKLHRIYAKAQKATLSDKDRDYGSMNVGWIYNNAANLGLLARNNEEAGTYRIIRAATKDED